MDLQPLEDSGEETALVQNLNRFDENIIFLEDEERSLCAFRLENSWKIRKIPAELEPELLADFLEYILELEKISGDFFSAGLSYYSLRPLVYTGEYWLEEVCRRELGNYRKNKLPFSVLVVKEVERGRLNELLDHLRPGDRAGYFGDMLAVILPGARDGEVEEIKSKLQNLFYFENFSSWQVGKDFENHHELRTRVEKKT